MMARLLVLLLAVSVSAVGDVVALATVRVQASCDVPACLSGAAEAMGGDARLRSLSAVETSGVAVWFHREQSERPEGPWLASFTDFTDVRRFAADLVVRSSRARGFTTNDWVDSTSWTAPSTVVVASGLGLARAEGGVSPAPPPPDLEALPVGLAPERMIVTARDAADLHAEPDRIVDGYLHHSVAFTHAGARVRLILNAPSLLPKAVEITRSHPYNMFLAPWGDVTQRVTFGMWTLEPDGLRYPRIWEFSTNGQPDGSVHITRVRSNPPVDSDVEISPEAARQAIASRRRIADIPLGSTARPAREIVPGIVKVPASFDIVEVRQDDGIVMIEAPLSSEYSAKAIADAKQRFPGAAIKALVTTSDAWPHIGGTREYVARGAPIYAFDLNVPILRRLFSATYVSDPDALAKAPRAPVLKVVSGKTVVGSGSNRFEIYPFRTATGERQTMIYWPAHKLLYTSDLFTIRNEFIFLPQQVNEAVQAVAREHLDVTAAFGMHYDVLPWDTVVKSGAPPRRPQS
jgi:hypothetical protein